jgi:CDP-4-dehydro-6-deoxyglucose reductase
LNTLLTVSRAARLVGVTRGVLQKKIKDGALTTFEGQVRIEDLQRLYPQVHVEDNSFLERLNLLKDGAYARRLRERILPDPEVLVVRLAELGKELSESRAELQRWRGLAAAFETTLQALVPVVTGTARQSLEALQQNLRALHPQPPQPEGTYPLAALDSALRVMSAHVRVLPTRHEFFVEGSDTLLEAALRAGLSMNYGCSNGNCGLCRATVQSGQVKKIRPHDYILTEADKQAGTVLMCCHTAVTDLVIEARETDAPQDIPLQQIAARVRGIDRARGEVAVLHLQTPRTRRLRFLAGQYVTLQAGDAPAVDYPIASCPCDDRNLQFHIPRTSDNLFAEKVFSDLRAGDTVNILGPRGNFVLHEESPHNLVFIATGTGFAPVKSLIEHAMALDVAESVSLYWFSSHEHGHYLDNQCRAWSDALDNFHYHPLTLSGENDELRRQLVDVARSHQPLRDCDVYVAGSPSLLEAAESVFAGQQLPPSQLVLGYPR